MYAEPPALVCAKRTDVASFLASIVTREMMWNILEMIRAWVKSYRSPPYMERIPSVVCFPMHCVALNVMKICKRIDHIFLYYNMNLCSWRCAIFLLNLSHQGHEWLEEPSLGFGTNFVVLHYTSWRMFVVIYCIICICNLYNKIWVGFPMPLQMKSQDEVQTLQDDPHLHTRGIEGRCKW